MRARPFAALLPVLAALALAPAASGQGIAWAPCAPQGFECGTLDVPLDHAGTTSGTVKLAAKRAVAAQNPGREAVLGIAGGPGQAALPVAIDIARVAEPALRGRDFLVFDQRGTGDSGRLRCNSLRPGAKLIDAARGCAAEIGPARAFYTTPQSVADIEALRVAGGYERFVIVAASYGAKVALRYAAAHPDRVAAMVLDSAVPPDGPDALRRSTLRAVPRVLRELCAGGRCRGITADAPRDLRDLAKRLARKPLTGTIRDAAGKKRKVTLDELGLYRIVLGGDLNPTLRAELPGAVRAALRRDATALLRLANRGAGLPGGTPTQTLGADALFITTTCEETPFQWTRGASLAQREREITARANAIPRAQLGGFSPRVALTGGVIGLCLGWPVASPAPAPTGPLPSVPTLVLSGRADVRTPLEDAERIAKLVPGAKVVGVPFTGHSVFGSDRSGCAAAQVKAFLEGTPATCPAARHPFPPAPVPPRRLDDLAPQRGTSGKPGRTLAAVRATLLDARRQVIGEAFATGRTPRTVGGLRAGRATVSGERITLRGYSFVPGVTVSGTVSLHLVGRVTVSGRSAARGSVTVADNGMATGTLGGRSVDASIQ